MGTLRILFVEDLATDVELAERELKIQNIDFQARVVDTEDAFREALQEYHPDVIVSDYAMPAFDGMRALEIARSAPENYPFIVLTGSMNEETAVACLKKGADDYVIKEKITRLPFAVMEVIEKYKILKEKKLAEAAVERNLARLHALREVETAVTSTLDLDIVLNIILGQIHHIISCDGLSIQILKGEALEIVACKGFKYPDQVVGLIYPLVPKFPNYSIVKERKQISFEDITRDYPHFKKDADVFGSHDIVSWLGVPLVAIGETIGMIAFDRNQLEPFSQEDIEIATAFSSQAAIAIQHARVYAQAERRLHNLQAMHNIDLAISGSLDIHLVLNVILSHVTQQLAVDAANILLLDPFLNTLEYAANIGFHTAALQYTRLKIGEGHAGKAALERRPVHILDLRTTQTGLLVSPDLKKEGFVSYLAVPLIAKGDVKGTIELFHRSRLDPDTEWLDLLRALSTQAAIAIDNANLFNELQRSNVDISLAYESTLEGWASALELKDAETEGHSQRVVDLTMRIAKKLGVEGASLADIRRGALLHDIGKMGVPDRILQKEGPLDEEEWKIMKQHPSFAHNMLSSIKYLQDALDIPYCHHEKWDGTGYPNGKKGTEIPLAARIFALADVWDALLSERPYRPSWPRAKALQHINEQSGTHFDPEVVRVFLEIIQDLDR